MSFEIHEMECNAKLEEDLKCIFVISDANRRIINL
jgi:hypothetical protein